MRKNSLEMNILNLEIMTLFQIHNFLDWNRLVMYKFDPIFYIEIFYILLFDVDFNLTIGIIKNFQVITIT